MTELAEKTLDLQYFIWLGSQRVGSPHDRRACRGRT
jgi:hypothetical protein